MNARDGNGARRTLEGHDGACTIGDEYGAGGDACKRDDHSGCLRTRLRCKDDRFWPKASVRCIAVIGP